MRPIHAALICSNNIASQLESTVPRIAPNQRTVVAGVAEGEEEGEEAARTQNPRLS